MDLTLHPGATFIHPQKMPASCGDSDGIKSWSASREPRDPFKLNLRQIYTPALEHDLILRFITMELSLPLFGQYSKCGESCLD